MNQVIGRLCSGETKVFFTLAQRLPYIGLAMIMDDSSTYVNKGIGTS